MGACSRSPSGGMTGTGQTRLFDIFSERLLADMKPELIALFVS
jgi:hypothetical protein